MGQYTHIGFGVQETSCHCSGTINTYIKALHRFNDSIAATPLKLWRKYWDGKVVRKEGHALEDSVWILTCICYMLSVICDTHKYITQMGGLGQEIFPRVPVPESVPL